MRPSKARFVTACQQLLALGVVLAVLTPAAGIISLDVVGEAPGRRAAGPGRRRNVRGLHARGRSSVGAPRRGRDGEGARVPAHAGVGRQGPRHEASPPGPRRRAEAPRRSTSSPEPVVGYGAVGVTWPRGEQSDDETLAFEVRTRTDADWSQWMTLPYDDEHGPDPEQRGGSARAAGHRRAARRQGRPGPGALGEHRGRAAGRHDAVGHRPGPRRGDRRPSAPRSRPPGSTRRAPAESAAAGATDALDLQAATLHPQAGDLLPQAVGRQRADAGPGLAPLLRGPRRFRPPHGQRQRLHARRGAGDPARHLRLPHAVPGLERRRLQLPRRQVRPDLGGPLRRRRPPGGRRPHPRLQRLLLRHVGDRQLRDRGAARTRCCRPTAALFAWKLSLHGVDASSGQQWVGTRYFKAINGHRDAGRPPARAATSTPSSP